MHRYCISLALLLAVTSGLHLEEFAQMTDYNSFFDMVLASVKDSSPSYVPGPPLNLDFTQRDSNNNSSPVGSFSGPNSNFGNFKTLKRNSQVGYELTAGNLSLWTTVSFDELSVSYAQSTISILNQNFEISASASVNNNEFKIQFTLYSKSDGTCAVDLKDARFTTLSDITVDLTPLGFFNQLNVHGKIKYLIKDVLDQFKDTNVALLQDSLERTICPLVAP